MCFPHAATHARAALQDKRDRVADELEQAHVLTTGIDLATWWPGASEAERASWVRTAVREVVVSPAVRRGGPFDPARVELRWSWPLLQRAAHGT